MEAHETQFISVIDPEQEAKAQAAISTYFKDKLSVPSPIDCPLRNQKIILPPSTPTRPTRDAICQTELTLPPHLPAELEALLRPFCTFTQNQQQSPSKVGSIGANSSRIDHDARDASLRRKLFDASLNSTQSSGDFRLELDECLSPAPTSPEIASSGKVRGNLNEHQRACSLSLSPVRNASESRCSSFGSLSPISRAAESPDHSAAMRSFENHIRVSENNSSIYQSTPGTINSSSLFLTCHTVDNHMSVDHSMKSATSRCISRSRHPIRHLSKSYGSDLSLMLLDDEEDHENVAPDTLSNSAPPASSGKMERSMNSSSDSPDSQHSGTPSRKLRRANRRNLSLSFGSSQFLNDDNESIMAEPNQDYLAAVSAKTQQPPPSDKVTSALLSQTDSGFNDMEE